MPTVNGHMVPSKDSSMYPYMTYSTSSHTGYATVSYTVYMWVRWGPIYWDYNTYTMTCAGLTNKHSARVWSSSGTGGLRLTLFSDSFTIDMPSGGSKSVTLKCTCPNYQASYDGTNFTGGSVSASFTVSATASTVTPGNVTSISFTEQTGCYNFDDNVLGLGNCYGIDFYNLNGANRVLTMSVRAGTNATSTLCQSAYYTLGQKPHPQGLNTSGDTPAGTNWGGDFSCTANSSRTVSFAQRPAACWMQIRAKGVSSTNTQSSLWYYGPPLLIMPAVIYKVDGKWQYCRAYIKDDGSWKEAKMIYTKDNGGWYKMI